MNKFLSLINNYYKYLYLLNTQKIVRIGAVKTSNIDVESSDSENIRNKIGLIITYVMTFLIIVCFLAIIVYLFCFNEKEIPKILHDTFIALLGYFGGTFVSFVKSSE